MLLKTTTISNHYRTPMILGSQTAEHSQAIHQTHNRQYKKTHLRKNGKSRISSRDYHSVACLMLELGRNDLFPEMLGFNSATVTTPILKNAKNSPHHKDPTKKLDSEMETHFKLQEENRNCGQRLLDIEGPAYSIFCGVNWEEKGMEWGESHRKSCKIEGGEVMTLGKH